MTRLDDRVGAADHTRGEDVRIALVLAVMAGAYLALTVRWRQPPMEDAAMLLRYAGHLSRGNGFVWNVGEAPVDGATDVLFTLVVAAVARCGVSLENAARGICAVSHAFTVALVYLAPRRIFNAPRAICALGAIFLALGPAKAQIGNAFGTPFFAACVAAAWAVALVAAERQSVWAETALPLLACLAGVARPEGAILGVMMLVAVAVVRPSGRVRFLARSLALFAIVGGGYFGWRWWYFGHPLPNPFYVKGGGTLYWSSLRSAVGNSARLVGPFVPLLALGPASRAGTRRLVLLAVPALVFIGSWLLLSNAMNFDMRFQYTLAPLVLMSAPGIANDALEQMRLQWLAMLPAATRTAGAIAAAVGVSLLLLTQHRATSYARPDGARDLATALAPYADRDYVMAVSEAGLLPLYSGWRAIDTWGLNDAHIAHHGLSDDYLDHVAPTLIAFHAFFSPIAPLSRSGVSAWDAMTLRLYDYAEARGYRLAACFGVTPTDTQYFYVHPNASDVDRIVDTIRSQRYRYMATGVVATDFAHLR